MSQYQKSYSVKINDQLNFVLTLANDLKRQVFSASVQDLLLLGPKKARSSVTQTFPKHGTLSSETYLIQQFVFDSDDDDEIESFHLQHQLDNDFGRKSFDQIVGLSQFDETQYGSQSSQLFFEQDSIDFRNRSFNNSAFVRGPYRSYRMEEKLKVIKLYKEGRTYAFISRFMQIPQKNIVRWCKNGVTRKQGAGRKIGDAKMQAKVLRWIEQSFKEGEYINPKQIRQKAMQMSTKQEFKSSKGWLKNFIRRHSLNLKYEIW